jgi:hypothetical protein
MDGAPVPDALVIAQDLRGFGGLVRTGPDGKYVLELMPCSRIRPRWPDRGWTGSHLPLREAEVLVAARAPGYTRSITRRVVARRSARTQVGPIAMYRGGRIEGRVIDTEGREVQARVRVVSIDSRDHVEGMQALPPAFPEGFVPSAPGAGFVLEPVGPGTVELWATAPGVGASHGKVRVAEGRTTRVDMPIEISAQIAGRVRERSGAAVAGVRVSCLLQADPSKPRASKIRVSKPKGGSGPGAGGRTTEALRSRGALATDTDESGLFFFYGVREGGLYTVSVAGARATAVSDVAPGRTDLVLEIPLRIDLTGTVRDAETGERLPGSAIRTAPAQQARFLRLTRPLGLEGIGKGLPSTDDDGVFRIPGLFPGGYRVWAMRAGYEVGEADVTIAEGDRSPALDITLHRAASLRGVVMDPDGNLVARAKVSLAVAPRRPGRPRRAPGRWSGRLFAATDEAGAFELTGLPAGEALVLRVRDEEGRSARVAVTLDRGERREETVRLEDPATLAVRVRPRSRGALAGYPVRIVGIDDPEIEVFAETDEDGVVRVSRLPPGRFRVMATDPLENPALAGVKERIATLDLGAGIVMDHGFDVPDITLVQGSVQYEGKAVKTGRVGFGPLPGTPDHYRPLLFEIKDGAYAGRVPPGRYHVSVGFPGKRFEIDEPVEVPAAATQRLDWKVP